MLLWNDSHPYNAIHVARVPKALNRETLEPIIQRTLEYLGLSSLTLNRESRTYQYHGGPVQDIVNLVRSEGDPRSVLNAEISRQLNTAFTLGQRLNPFRFFVVPESDSFFLGLTYLHVIADAESIMLLMKDIVEAYLGKSGVPPASPIKLYPVRGDGLFQHPGRFLRKLMALPSLMRNLQRSRRYTEDDSRSPNNEFIHFSLEAKQLRSLVRAAKKLDVTLNDLFLALLMKCLFPLVAQCPGKSRHNLSLGCVVNTRRLQGMEIPRAFGFFLGSFIVTLPIAPDMSLSEVAQEICRQTGRIKQKQLYLGPPLEMVLGRFFLSLSSTERQKVFYLKHYPLWGGITNMNLNSLWQQNDPSQFVDYFRAVSTGPATALVLSVTTVREALNISLTFRPACIPLPQASKIQNDFIEAVKALDQAA